ncbi:hypothetical protein CK223_32335 [Mesorhizobium loti]|nr:hypothetical protein CK223_32335 [Mesorhizobium loti]
MPSSKRNVRDEAKLNTPQSSPHYQRTLSGSCSRYRLSAAKILAKSSNTAGNGRVADATSAVEDFSGYQQMPDKAIAIARPM